MNSKIRIIRFLMVAVLLCDVWGIEQAHGQFLGGFFNQKATERKYMVAQIAALQLYSSYLKKGYDITRDGFGLANDLKTGEFILHKEYFTSLSAVKPVLRNHQTVAEIRDMDRSIRRRLDLVAALITSSDEFTRDERSYLHRLCTKLRERCEADLMTLSQVTTTDWLKLTDDERLARIQVVYYMMRDKQSFARSLYNDVCQLDRQRIKAKSEIQQMKLIYQLR